LKSCFIEGIRKHRLGRRRKHRIKRRRERRVELRRERRVERRRKPTLERGGLLRRDERLPEPTIHAATQ
jgi:hypothetical protein